MNMLLGLILGLFLGLVLTYVYKVSVIRDYEDLIEAKDNLIKSYEEYFKLIESEQMKEDKKLLEENIKLIDLLNDEIK